MSQISQSKVLYAQSLPNIQSLGSDTLVIYDQHLLKASANFKKWLKGAPLSYAVKAGEDLKDVQFFARHIQKISQLTQKTSARNLTVIVVGGGSVGDFGGFVASILKRGVRLVMIPSTWLAAVDSAHGGKTALNVSGMKNQIGTFYPAEKVFLCRDLLFSQTEARVFEGFGEVLKMALLAGGPFWKRLSQERQLSREMLWKYLPLAVKAKYKVVNKDPKEQSGYRHILNFGHTLGHALESYYALPHGVAINYGMDFSIRWSLRKKIMSAKTFSELEGSAVMSYLLSATRDDLFSVKESFLEALKTQMLGDKKKTQSQKLRFIFLKKPGQPVVREVSVNEILIEVCSQIEEEHD